MEEWNLDFGNFDCDIDLNAFEVSTNENSIIETRYIKPKFTPLKSKQICYEHARKLATDIGIIKDGDRYDCIVSGAFIFGDFLEAYLVENALGCEELTITTLSMSQENIDSLHTLLAKHYVNKLNLIISDYFYSHERHALVPYIYDYLDINNKFQLSVASIHTKTMQLKMEDGTKIVMHGSANLRSSANVEQFTIEANPELYDFYDNLFMVWFLKG